MARSSSIHKNVKRKKMVARYYEKIVRLVRQSKDKNCSMDERVFAMRKLAALPRDCHPSRVRNRCNITVRPRGYNRVIGLSRISFRKLASEGLLPGVVKSSW